MIGDAIIAPSPVLSFCLWARSDLGRGAGEYGVERRVHYAELSGSLAGYFDSCEVLLRLHSRRRRLDRHTRLSESR